MTGRHSVKRGEVWMIDFGSDPTDPDSVDSPRAFIRPALIVSEDRLHHPNLKLVIVVPGTSTLRNIPLHVTVEPDEINGLNTVTSFQVEQVRAVSTTRLDSRLGTIGSSAMYTIEEILRNTLRL